MPADGALARLDQAVAEAQEQALAGAVGADHHGPDPCLEAAVDVFDQPVAAGLETDAVQFQGQDLGRAHACHRRVACWMM